MVKFKGKVWGGGGGGCGGGGGEGEGVQIDCQFPGKEIYSCTEMLLGKTLGLV